MTSRREEFWLTHLSAIAAEGIETKAYADREGLSALSLYQWRKRLKTKRGESESPKGHERRPPFVAVRVGESVPKSHCTLIIAPGMRLELPHLPTASWLAELSAALQQGVN